MAIKILCDYCNLEITKEREVGTLVHIKEKILFIPNKSQNQGGNIIKEKTETHLCSRCLEKVFKALKK